jgi:hypothetical protein
VLVKCKNVAFIRDVSSSLINFLISILEARRSLEYLNYVRETKMIPPLLTAMRLHSLIEERKKHPIIYNEFFIKESINDLIIIYKSLGADLLVKKLQRDLEELK